MKMFVKINVCKIISGHFSTLVDARTEKIGGDDIFTFIILPIAVALGLTILGISINPSATSIIITSLAIFVGLLINMVVLLFDLLNQDVTNKIKLDILKELLSNILFTILLSIVLIILSLVGLITLSPVKHPYLHYVVVALDFCIYFLLTFLFFTLLMVLKRIYTLFTNEFSEIEDKARIKKEIEENK